MRLFVEGCAERSGRQHVAVPESEAGRAKKAREKIARLVAREIAPLERHDLDPGETESVRLLARLLRRERRPGALRGDETVAEPEGEIDAHEIG